MCVFMDPACAGVGIGVVDVGYERRLANHLGAHRTPSILGVVNGKVTFFHYAVSTEHLRQFVEDLLPQRLVERVSVLVAEPCVCVFPLNWRRKDAKRRQGGNLGQACAKFSARAFKWFHVNCTGPITLQHVMWYFSSFTQ